MNPRISQSDLDELGIYNAREILHNPTYDHLFSDELDPDMSGFEKGH